MCRLSDLYIPTMNPITVSVVSGVPITLQAANMIAHGSVKER